MLHIRRHAVPSLPSQPTATPRPLYVQRLISLKQVSAIELQPDTNTLRIKLVGESTFENIQDGDGESVRRVFNEVLRHTRATGVVIEL